MAAQIRNTYTAVLVRGDLWQDGTVHTEPYEAAWAGEAVFFIRLLEVVRGAGGPVAEARVQISPDGMHWVDEGSSCDITPEAGSLSFARTANFGGWLRLAVTVPPDMAAKVVVTLALKA